jgi:hypothetical protein
VSSATPTITVIIPDAPALPSLPTGRITRPAVVLVVGPGPVAEIYSDLPIRLHVAERLAVEHPDDELLADEYLDSTLPPWARDVYMPGRLRALVPIRPRTVEAEGERLRRLEVLRILQDLGQEIREGQAAVSTTIIPGGHDA